MNSKVISETSIYRVTMNGMKLNVTITQEHSKKVTTSNPYPPLDQELSKKEIQSINLEEPLSVSSSNIKKRKLSSYNSNHFKI